jgi:hypothetical protein
MLPAMPPSLQGSSLLLATAAHIPYPMAQVIYELRNYQLHPGYGSVPKLLEAFAKG